MKYLKISILFFTGLLSAQVSGIVVDSLTQKPIPYVNIWAVEGAVGTTTEPDGTFHLSIEKNKKIGLSALGYETKYTAASEKEIKLKPAAIQLNEQVVYHKKLKKFKEVGDGEKSNISHHLGTNPWVFAKYFSYIDTYKSTPFLQKIVVYTYSDVEDAILKIRVFGVDAEGKPSNDLVFENILTHVKKGKKRTVADVSVYNIKLPENGIVVGIEPLFVEQNKYNFEYIDKGKQIVKQNYAPKIFCLDKTENNVWENHKDVWYKRKLYLNKLNKVKEETVVEPCINLILSD